MHRFPSCTEALSQTDNQLADRQTQRKAVIRCQESVGGGRWGAEWNRMEPGEQGSWLNSEQHSSPTRPKGRPTYQAPQRRDRCILRRVGFGALGRDGEGIRRLGLCSGLCLGLTQPRAATGLPFQSLLHLINMTPGPFSPCGSVKNRQRALKAHKNPSSEGDP